MNRRQQLARPGNLAALAKINPNKRLFFFTNFFVFDFFSIIGSLFFHLVSFLLFFFFCLQRSRKDSTRRLACPVLGRKRNLRKDFAEDDDEEEEAAKKERPGGRRKRV